MTDNIEDPLGWMGEYDIELNEDVQPQKDQLPQTSEYGRHGEKLIESISPEHYGLPQYDRFLIKPVLKEDGTGSFSLWGESYRKTAGTEPSMTQLYGPGWEPLAGNELDLVKNEDELRRTAEEVTNEIWKNVASESAFVAKVEATNKEYEEAIAAQRLEEAKKTAQKAFEEGGREQKNLQKKLDLYPVAEDQYVGTRFKELIPLEALVRDRSKVLNEGKIEEGIKDNPLLTEDYYRAGMSNRHRLEAKEATKKTSELIEKALDTDYKTEMETKHEQQSKKAEKKLIIRSTTAQTRRLEKQARDLMPNGDE